MPGPLSTIWTSKPWIARHGGRHVERRLVGDGEEELAVGAGRDLARRWTPGRPREHPLERGDARDADEPDDRDLRAGALSGAAPARSAATGASVSAIATPSVAAGLDLRPSAVACDRGRPHPRSRRRSCPLGCLGLGRGEVVGRRLVDAIAAVVASSAVGTVPEADASVRRRRFESGGRDVDSRRREHARLRGRRPRRERGGSGSCSAMAANARGIVFGQQALEEGVHLRLEAGNLGLHPDQLIVELALLAASSSSSRTWRAVMPSSCLLADPRDLGCLPLAERRRRRRRRGGGLRRPHGLADVRASSPCRSTSAWNWASARWRASSAAWRMARVRSARNFGGLARARSRSCGGVGAPGCGRCRTSGSVVAVVGVSVVTSVVIPAPASSRRSRRSWALVVCSRCRQSSPSALVAASPSAGEASTAGLRPRPHWAAPVARHLPARGVERGRGWARRACRRRQLPAAVSALPGRHSDPTATEDGSRSDCRCWPCAAPRGRSRRIRRERSGGQRRRIDLPWYREPLPSYRVAPPDRQSRSGTDGRVPWPMTAHGAATADLEAECPTQLTTMSAPSRAGTRSRLAGPGAARPPDLGHRPLQLPVRVLHAEGDLRQGLRVPAAGPGAVVRGDRAAGRIFVGLGVEKLRITGGEPLVRRDLPTLVAQLAATPPARRRDDRPDADDERGGAANPRRSRCARRACSGSRVSSIRSIPRSSGR